MTSSIDERTSTTVKNDESLKEVPDSPDAGLAPQQLAARCWQFWAISPSVHRYTLLGLGVDHHFDFSTRNHYGVELRIELCLDP